LNNFKKIDKPWGYEIWWANTEKYVGKFLHINPESRLSLQYHEKKEETVYVMKGNLLLWESNDEKDCKILTPGSVYHVNPGQTHRFGAGKIGVMLCEISTPETDDIIRIADDYNR
jgi:quercetin dioxygenase-like cupin family protein